MEVVHKGFKITDSNSRGGKAGAGFNKTKTMRVIEELDSGFIIKKQYSFRKDDVSSMMDALRKCKAFIDEKLLNN